MANDQITYLGRNDDMMNAGGFRVSPLEVEAVLASYDGITAVGAAEVEIRPDVRVIAAFYTGPRALDEDALRLYAEANLARYKQPRLYVHLPSLPMGANGKILRRALRAEFRGTPMTDPIKLDIMSDPICPWCYIGKAHLDRALGRPIRIIRS